LVLGDYYAARGEHKKAKEAYEAGLRETATDPELRCRRVLVERQQAGRFTDDGGRELARIIEIVPKYPEAHYLLALYYRERRDTENTIVQLRDFVQTTPASTSPYKLLANEYYAAGQIALAIKTLERARDLEPDNVDVLDLLAVSYFTNRQYEDARTTCEKRLQRDSNSIETQLILTASLFRLGKPEAAVASAANLERVAGTDRYAQQVLKMMRDQIRPLLGTGSFAAAHEFFEAEDQFKSKNYPDAVAHYNAALEVEPCFEKAWLYLGDAYYATEDYDHALVSYTKALEIDPRDKYAWRYAGDAYRKQGRFEDALRAYKMAVQLDPGYMSAVESAAFVDRELRHRNRR
jgi:tetratricopeptide (TPR) repeat protein